MIQNVDFGLTMACAFVLFGLGCYYVFMHFLVICEIRSTKDARKEAMST